MLYSQSKECQELQDSIEEESVQEMVADMINNPPHYQSDNGIECIDAIQAQLTPEEFRGYLKGNMIKYTWRMNDKDTPESNLGKIIWYANRLKEFLSDVSKKII